MELKKQMLNEEELLELKNSYICENKKPNFEEGSLFIYKNIEDFEKSFDKENVELITEEKISYKEKIELYKDNLEKWVQLSSGRIIYYCE